MTTENSARFELQGRFVGFFRDLFGKRRMALCVADDEIYLKVPKALRRELEGRLMAGQEVVVTGQQSSGERGARVVSQVRIAGQEVCVSCPVRICTKKNCWRSGGKELWADMERRIAAAGLADSVKLQAVDCLDHCKLAPNIEHAGQDYHRCTPRDLDAILTRLAE
jgi:hypothetical protein